jgi:hypothetical protein
LTYIITIKIRRKEMSLARIGRLILTTGAVTAVVAGMGTLAHAQSWAYWTAAEGSDYAGVRIDRKYIGACDLEQDGNGVYAEYNVSGSSSTFRIGDGNGSQAGCGVATPSRSITRFRVCEDDTGSDTCSPWEPVP